MKWFSDRGLWKGRRPTATCIATLAVAVATNALLIEAQQPPEPAAVLGVIPRGQWPPLDRQAIVEPPRPQAQVPPRTLLVWADSPAPAPPFATWTTAARTIQEAIDETAEGDVVLVTNGVYSSGGRLVDLRLGGRLVDRRLNRVAVTKAITLRSVNGPEVTWILGASATRGVYLVSGATLSGFTVSEGSAFGGFGSGGGVWCQSTNAVVTNCHLIRNSAVSGGGVHGGTVRDCLISDNSATGDGGGAESCSLFGCTLSGNSAPWGGGAAYCTLVASHINGNIGGDEWGGVGGAAWCDLTHCTVTDNRGGGVAESTLRNCIVWDNEPVNHDHFYGEVNTESSSFEYSCTFPLPPGPGNLAAIPRFIAAGRLAPDSPCIGAASPAFAAGTDIDGEAWADRPSMGADEPRRHGPLRLWLDAAMAEFAAGYPVRFAASVQGSVTHSIWDFGDGTTMTNVALALHAWTRPGVYRVTLTGYNDDHREGVPGHLEVRVVEGRHHYVNPENLTPEPPYASWETAASRIQDAVDYAQDGSAVWVTNGVYRSGTRELEGSNRLVITNRVIVRSVHGPEVTVIDGEDAVRCAYLGDGAVLEGFTLRGAEGWGHANRGAGVRCASRSALVHQCILRGNFGSSGGGAHGGTLQDCLLIENGSWRAGGGAYGAVLRHCTLLGNGSDWGGGAMRCQLEQCRLEGNWASSGAAARESFLEDCVLTENRTETGRGLIVGGTLRNCVVTNNPSGIHGATLHNCLLTRNSGVWTTWDSDLEQCTVTDNAGGVRGGRILNSIVYFNRGPLLATNWHDAVFESSCTTPLPPGPGNLDADPQFASSGRLAATSPCIGAGNPGHARGRDIDGDPWLDPPSMGTDESGTSGPLAVEFDAELDSVAIDYPVSFTAHSSGGITSSRWDFGDDARATNRAFATHAWSRPGVYEVTFTGAGASPGDEAVAQKKIEVREALHFVDADARSPAFPYTSWATAAKTLQAAVAAVSTPGATVWVTNGIYSQGGAVAPDGVSSRVVLTNRALLRSVNGAEVTTILGFTNARCLFVGDGSRVEGFTLTGGKLGSFSWGGGVACAESAVVAHCRIVDNSAAQGGGSIGGVFYHSIFERNHAREGGGSTLGTYIDCLFRHNAATNSGGAVFDGRLIGCVVIENTAGHWAGGGVYPGPGSSFLGPGLFLGTRIVSSIVVSNAAPQSPNYHPDPNGFEIAYSCSHPLPPGPGNLDADPRFLDAAAGDFRLHPDSPCIDAGDPRWSFSDSDLTGGPRVFDGNGDGVARVDMGAYEYLRPAAVFTRVSLSATGLVLEWSAHRPGAQLQRCLDLGRRDWHLVPGTKGASSTTIPLNQSAAFFRLIVP